MRIPPLSGFKNTLKTYVLSDFSLSNPFIITSYAGEPPVAISKRRWWVFHFSVSWSAPEVKTG